MNKSPRWLALLAGFCLSTAALAQPAGSGTGSGSNAPADPPVVNPAPVAPGACCPEACCTKKICVPHTEIKKTPHPSYCCKCEDFCLPKCNFFSMLRGKGCDCDCDQTCCKMWHKKKLVKWIDECEECVTRCHVEEVPCCEQAPCLPPPCASGTIEGVPPPKK